MTAPSKSVAMGTEFVLTSSMNFILPPGIISAISVRPCTMGVFLNTKSDSLMFWGHTKRPSHMGDMLSLESHFCLKGIAHL